eukprot:CAMPEP_0113297854 /NCGR_PEP_ID=MMETSP0010_2-20120614/540_1 /TAXON_ID=216773 ORGANISM="Corethron hystrix, Strain 308" /NCGR_SAMPLE_ID=MMETSP0010_2 /ASSEMBLY_ACC=CAM_ASM_000155 /LENGTH=188 /DNA_ID=CAMNT_0000150807 /DNA_START=388 /DNA_END=954 /DNA_ORIENTATION=+ /assembly_acc=CAM_ASM_000155
MARFSSTSPTLTADEITDYCVTQSGVNLTISSLGPAYRAVARSLYNNTNVLGYCAGFIRPTGSINHMDTMEVFRPALEQAKIEDPTEKFGNGGSIFGVGLLLGLFCVRHGLDNGCSKVEFLAIDDGERQHKRLVRHYSRLGLEIVRYVGDDLRDVPARMVWGGRGTLMDGRSVDLLEKWSPMFRGEIS